MTLSELSVLLVEPSKAQANVAKSFLADLDISDIRWLKEGKAALTEMLDTPPDLVISAMYLPDMTGTDLVTKMRSDEALESITFLLVSSETNYRYLEPIRQAGAIGILSKPYKLADLKKALLGTVDLLTMHEDDTADREPETLKVLLVDDSLSARRYVKKILEGLGIKHFVEAENGKEAIEKINTEFFDLIITDYNMPEMDGESLIRYVRNESNQSSIPILMISSESSNTRLAAVQQAGVSAVCNKVFEPASIKQLLNKILSEG